MGILEQVTKMKEQGIPDNQIANKLQEQRVSPKEINDALNQSKIKMLYQIQKVCNHQL